MDPKRRARIILILGVLLAAFAFIGTFLYAESAKTGSAPEPPPTVEVVVAAREIPARTALTAADVKVARINVDAAPPLGLKDPKEAIGKVTLLPVSMNEPILASKFAPVGRDFTVFPPGEELQPGSPAYRVMVLNVDDQSAVGGVLQQGDLVDIMYVFQFDPTKYIAGLTPDAPAGGTTGGAAPSTEAGTPTSDTVAKIILGPMRILSRATTIYTIRVDAALAERLAYIQASGGQLQFLLRSPGDERAAGTTGATFKEVYENFKFPIPERFELSP